MALPRSATITLGIGAVVLIALIAFFVITQAAPKADVINDETEASLSSPLSDTDIQAGRGAYKIQDIGAIGTTIGGSILGMNNNGTIVGYKADPKDPYGYGTPFIRRVDKPMQTLPDSIMAPGAINDNGVVLGYDNFHRPIFYNSRTGKIQLVKEPLGFTHLKAINKQNLIAGDIAVPNSGVYPVYHTFTMKTGSPTPQIIPDLGIQVADMNNKGEIVGSSLENGNQIAYSYTPASGKQAFAKKGYPIAINNNGTVVGAAELGRIYRFRGGGGEKDLGTLGPVLNAGYAFDVNDKEQIVGTSDSKAFLYTDATGMRDLNTLLPSGTTTNLTVAKYINNQGMIAAIGTESDGNRHAYLLIPKNRR